MLSRAVSKILGKRRRSNSQSTSSAPTLNASTDATTIDGGLEPDSPAPPRQKSPRLGSEATDVLPDAPEKPAPSRQDIEPVLKTWRRKPLLKKTIFPEGNTLGLTVLHEPKHISNTLVDIIFVHGLTGDAYDTWFKKDTKPYNENEREGQNKKIKLEKQRRGDAVEDETASGVFWPTELLPGDIADARILTFGYDADVTKVFGAVGQGRLRDHADALLGDLAILRDSDDTQDRKIIFVSHSLGGLLVKKALCLSESSVDERYKQADMHTIAIAFLGTPHRGSSFALYAHGIAYIMKTLRKRTNTNIIGLLKPGSEVLTDLEESFGIWLRKKGDRVQVAPFYEELELPVVGQVVSKDSAKILGFVPMPIHANHMDMTKFDSLNNPGYRRVMGQLNSWLKPIREEALKSKELSQAQEECLRKLHFEDLCLRQETLSMPLNNTFEWVWQQNECGFTNWTQHGGQIFWIRGKPGSGKSTLVKYLAENIPKRVEQGLVPLSRYQHAVIVATHFFESTGNQLSRSIDGLLRSLLWQLLKQYPDAFSGIMPLFEDLKSTHSILKWSRNDLEQSLKRVMRLITDTLVLFVDAVDEFNGERLAMLKFLFDLSHESPANTRVCVSSRPHSEFESAFRQCPGLVIEEKTTNDIEMYISTVCGEILQSPTYRLECQALVRNLLRRADGVFLWVKLASENLVRGFARCEDPSQLWRRLSQLPDELTKLYMRIIADMDDDDRDDVEQMLAIVLTAARPLTLFEFHYVLARQRKSALAFHSIEKRIRAVCTGLLEVRTDKVYVAHETVYTFLKSSSNDPLNRLRDTSLQRGHLYILKACLQRFQANDGLSRHSSTIRINRKSNFGIRDGGTTHFYQKAVQSFSNYAVLHWLEHAKAAQESTGVNESELPAQPWLSAEQYLLWRELYLAIRWEADGLTSSSFGTPLYNVATLLQVAMLHVINTCLQHDVFAISWRDIDYRQAVQSCLFSFAAKCGVVATTQTYCSFEQVNDQLQASLNYDKDPALTLQISAIPKAPVQISTYQRELKLRDPGVTLEVAPKEPTTNSSQDVPFLYIPVEEEERNDIQFLLERVVATKFIDENTLNRGVGVSSQPLLSTGRSASLQSVFDHIMEWGIPAQPLNSDSLLRDPGTPLQYAAYHALPTIVHVLLVNGADPNVEAKSSMFGTALIAAIYSVERALEKGGGAIQNGLAPQIAIIEMLLKWKTDPNIAASGTWCGLKTPLEAACRIYQSHSNRIGRGLRPLEQIIKLLFTRGAKPDSLTRALVRPMKDTDLWAIFQKLDFVRRKTQWDFPDEQEPAFFRDATDHNLEPLTDASAAIGILRTTIPLRPVGSIYPLDSDRPKTICGTVSVHRSTEDKLRSATAWT